MSIKVRSHGRDMEIDKEELDRLREYYPPEILEELLADKDFVADFIPKPEIPFYSHVLATPLVEVISVSIHNKQSIVDDGIMMSYEIYGTIQVIDGEGSTFNLYDRKDYQPETVPIGGTLTITVPKGCAIIPSNVVKMEIDLKDQAQNNAEIVKGSLCWDYSSHDDYDQVKTKVIDGVRASAAVQYITYRHAVIATVEVILVKGKDDESTSAHVHGSIAARCGNNYSSLLFNKKQNESVEVEYGTCIELYRHVVVVPALSFLKIDANLWDTEKQIAVGDQELPACGSSHSTQYFGGQNGLVEMGVQWSRAYMQTQSPLEKRLGESSSGKNIDMFPVPKRSRLIQDQQPVSALSIERSFLSALRISFEQWGFMLMEVFSVSICSDNDENFNVWGSITYRDRRHRFVLFDRDEVSPERLLRNQTVPIESSIKFFSSAFELVLYLIDVNGHQISDGDIVWDERVLENESCYDIPLCSVVQGDDGYYAAVHYSIFSTGVQATLKIYLLNNKSSSLEFKVDGSVFTEYSNWNYMTLYKKEYYRKKLFVKHTGDPSLLHNTDSKVLLSDSVFAVPGNSDLIVDVSLEVFSLVAEALGEVQIDEKRKRDETFKARLKFETDIHGTSQQKIDGILRQLLVQVEWKKVFI